MIAAAVLCATALMSAPAATGVNICGKLDTYPSVDGVSLVIFDVVRAGYDTESGSELIVQTVISQCPEYIPILERWVEVNGR